MGLRPDGRLAGHRPGSDPPGLVALAGRDDPTDAWISYVLAAPLLCLRRRSADWAAPPGVTFADWLDGALPDPPTTDDLDYHVSTLFPPVRPRGYLELRYLDAQPGRGGGATRGADRPVRRRRAPCGEAYTIATPVAHRWLDAARHGLADPALGAAAAALLDLALGAMPRLERRPAPTTRSGEGYASGWPPQRGETRSARSEPVLRADGARAPGRRRAVARRTSPSELARARARTALLTDGVDDADLIRQHSPLMSPLVWDLAHIGNQEELWLLRDVGGREPMRARHRPAVRRVRAPARRPAGAAAAAARPRPARYVGTRSADKVLDLLDAVPLQRHARWSPTGSPSA